MRRSYSRVILALTLILIASAILLLSLGGYLDSVKGLILRPLSGIQEWISSRFTAVRDWITSPREIASLQAQISDLENENSQLKQEIITLREQLAETRILEALLDYARSRPDNVYLASDVIGKDVSPFLRWVLIGAGSDDGITRAMPVVGAEGLVGRVMDVYATVSRVQLITDPNAAVNVKLQSSRSDERADGVLVAELSGELRVELIDPDVDVQPGDLVLTSGLGGSFPADIPVGQVISVRTRDYELFQQAVIQPAVDFGRLNILLVITNFRALPLAETSP
ncbi:MAG: rod shape-determining protein MreC [Anaerolineales bacterium]|jgi:rod shape-determining protein MreC